MNDEKLRHDCSAIAAGDSLVAILLCPVATEIDDVFYSGSCRGELRNSAHPPIAWVSKYLLAYIPSQQTCESLPLLWQAWTP